MSLDKIFESIDELVATESGIGRNGEWAKTYGHEAAKQYAVVADKTTPEYINRHKGEVKELADKAKRAGKSSAKDSRSVNDARNTINRKTNKERSQISVQDYALNKARSSAKKDRAKVYDKAYDKAASHLMKSGEKLGRKYTDSDKDYFNRSKYDATTGYGVVGGDMTILRDDETGARVSRELKEIQNQKEKQARNERKPKPKDAKSFKDYHKSMNEWRKNKKVTESSNDDILDYLEYACEGIDE